MPACLRGLSPLARGTQFICASVRRCRRFIPAGAGNTVVDEQTGLGRAVYPRWRGEHPLSAVWWQRSRGLSPLARGTPRRSGAIPIIFRFIPAGAGNTLDLFLLRMRSSVYPRWRGEHFPARSTGKQRAGLSPLARGTQDVQSIIHSLKRFIPAGAGNTSNSKTAHRPTTVYPRWRGEHALVPDTFSGCAGLSPLARGTPAITLSPDHYERFIPAGAGNTPVRRY